jgi:hypothetical protein
LEFKVGNVWEALEGWVGWTTAVKSCFVVLFRVLSRTRVDTMTQSDGCHNLYGYRKNSMDPIDLLAKRMLFYVPSKILKSRATGAVPIPRSLHMKFLTSLVSNNRSTSILTGRLLLCSKTFLFLLLVHPLRKTNALSPPNWQLSPSRWGPNFWDATEWPAS